MQRKNNTIIMHHNNMTPLTSFLLIPKTMDTNNENNLVSMDESVAADYLESNLRVSNSNKNEIQSISAERSARAQKIVASSPYHQQSINEWLIHANAFIYVDYNIERKIDFYNYRYPTNIEIVYEPEDVLQHPDPYISCLNNLFNKFIHRVQNQTFNLFDELNRFIDDFYLADVNRATRNDDVENFPELVVLHQTKPDATTFQLSTDLTNHIIHKLLWIEVNYDSQDNNPQLLSSTVDEFLRSRFPVELVQDLDIKLPSSDIDAMFNYSIIHSNGLNLNTINAPDSIKAFYTLLASRFQTIPLYVLLTRTLGNERNAVNPISPNQQIQLYTESFPIYNLEDIGSHRSYENIETQHPSIFIEFAEKAPNNQKPFIYKLLDTYEQPTLLISSFITHPYYRELFYVAKNLFNNFEFYKAINICRYIGGKLPFSGSLSDVDNDESKTKNKHYHLHNISEIDSRPSARIKELYDKNAKPQPSVCDRLIFTAYRQRNIKAILWLTLITVLLVALVTYPCITYYRKRKGLCSKKMCQTEAFHVMTKLRNTPKSRKSTIL